MATWTPTESNPDELTQYIHKLGVSPEWSFIDVYGLDDEMLECIPRPIKAVILLYPHTQAQQMHRSEETERLSAKYEEHPKDLFYMHQATLNSCGTIALIHSVANNKDISVGGVLKSFIENTQNLNPAERGKALERNRILTAAHQVVPPGRELSSDPDDIEAYHHFIALINKNGILYELDGCKSFPIKHGVTSEQTFIQDAAKVCREFMARDPDDVRFTVLALVPTQQ